ncbi:MAG: hypothetical protein QW665_03295 [Metallosphaera sp.]
MSAKTLKACRSCKALVSKEVQQCPICNGTTFSDECKGKLVGLNALIY